MLLFASQGKVSKHQGEDEHVADGKRFFHQVRTRNSSGSPTVGRAVRGQQINHTGKAQPQ